MGLFDVSGFGVRVQCLASNTFPVGFLITQFSDDADSLDLPTLEVAATTMGLNGDMVVASKASVIPVTINVIPGSDDDVNLAILLNANRVASGKKSARDIITFGIIYPDESTGTLKQGKIISGMPGKSINSSGKMKSKAYTFAFSDFVSTNV